MSTFGAKHRDLTPVPAPVKTSRVAEIKSQGQNAAILTAKKPEVIAAINQSNAGQAAANSAKKAVDAISPIVLDSNADVEHSIIKLKFGNNAGTSAYLSKFPSQSGSLNKLNDVGVIAVSDNTPVSEILKRIAIQKGWKAEEMIADLEEFEAQRLRTVGDLRELSAKNWESIKCPGIVKDLISAAIH